MLCNIVSVCFSFYKLPTTLGVSVNTLLWPTKLTCGVVDCAFFYVLLTRFSSFGLCFYVVPGTFGVCTVKIFGYSYCEYAKSF